jgi:hypothetical protein
MFTCSVLRCTNPGSAFTAGCQNLQAPGYHEAYICTEHKALIEAGAPWDMEGRNVLMGQDLAPILANWSARPSVGSEGFTLTLEIEGQIKPFEVFLMPSEARTLSSFINAANADGGHCA